MADADPTITILREIRGEIRGTNGRLESLRGETRGGFAAVRRELEQLRADTNARFEKIEEAPRDLAAQQLMLGRYLRSVVDRQEQQLTRIVERLARLETKVG